MLHSRCGILDMDLAMSLAANGNSKPDIVVITRISKPKMGYVTILVIMILCALVLLRQRNNLPKEGVCTPCIVFGPNVLQ